MQNKKKGKGSKGGQEPASKQKQAPQGKIEPLTKANNEPQKTPEELMNMQAELMNKLKAMKDMLGNTAGKDGINPGMFEDLFKNLLGGLDGNPPVIEREKYIESEPAHQEFMGEIDHTLARKSNS